MFDFRAIGAEVVVQFRQIASCVAAILFAALAPALVAAGLDGSIRILPYEFAIALGHAVVLGLPLFLVLRRKRWVNAISSTGAGFIIGAFPFGALAFPWLQANGSASFDGVPTVVNGVPTLAGWLIYGEFLLALGAFGALGGFVFWATLRVSGSLALANKTTSDIVARKDYARIRISGAALAVIAVLFAGAVLAIPSITKDRTCHNMFRDGRTSIGSQVNMEVDIAIEDWPKMTKLFESFGQTHNLSFQNSSHDRPGVVKVLTLSLCNERGVNILVVDQRWASHDFGPLMKDRGVPIIVYEVQEGSGWKQSTRDMVSELDSAWPGMVKFRDGSGRVIPMPDALQNPEANAPTAPGATTEKH